MDWKGDERQKFQTKGSRLFHKNVNTDWENEESYFWSTYGSNFFYKGRDELNIKGTEKKLHTIGILERC